MHAKILRMTFSTRRPVPRRRDRAGEKYLKSLAALSAAASEIPSIPTKWKTANMALQPALHCGGIPRVYQALPHPDSLSLSLYLHSLPPRFRARTSQDKYSAKPLLCVSSRRVPTTATARTFWQELRLSVHMGPEDLPLETAAVVKNLRRCAGRPSALQLVCPLTLRQRGVPATPRTGGTDSSLERASPRSWPTHTC